MADPRTQPRRVTPDFDPRSGGLRPAATSRFDFVPPPRQSDFSDALKSLSQLEPQIETITDRIAARDTEKDKLAGTQKALENGGMSEEDAVKAGVLSPADTKAFRVGYKQQYWRVQSIGWADQAKEAWNQDPAKNSDDPAAAQRFLGKFFADKLKTIADPAAREAALPIINQTVANIIGAQSEYRTQRVQADNLQNYGTEAQSIISDIASGRLNPANAQAKFTDLEARAKAQGVDMDKFNEQIALAITNKAREAGSTQLLEVRKMFPKLAGNPKYESAFRAADDAITTKAYAAQARALAAQDHADRIRDKKALSDAMLEVIKSGTELPPDRQAYYAAINPAAVTLANSYAKGRRDEAKETDPNATYQAWLHIVTSDNPLVALGEIQKQQTAGLIKGVDIHYLQGIAIATRDAPGAASMSEVQGSLRELEHQFRNNGPMAALGFNVNPQQLAWAKMNIVQAIDKERLANPGLTRGQIQQLTDRLVYEQTLRLQETAKKTMGVPAKADVDKAIDATNGRIAPPEPAPAPAGAVPKPPASGVDLQTQRPGAAAPAPKPAAAAPDYTKLSADELAARLKASPQEKAAILKEWARRKADTPKQ